MDLIANGKTNSVFAYHSLHAACHPKTHRYQMSDGKRHLFDTPGMIACQMTMLSEHLKSQYSVISIQFFLVARC